MTKLGKKAKGKDIARQKNEMQDCGHHVVTADVYPHLCMLLCISKKSHLDAIPNMHCWSVGSSHSFNDNKNMNVVMAL